MDIGQATRLVWTIFEYTGDAVPVTYLIEYALFEGDGLTVCRMVPGNKFILELPETQALEEHRVDVADLVRAHAS
ncbi:MAG: hypothetical protein WC734_01750 [Patescibacteria group bacterium]|jgi:hypothetical protein